MGGILYTMHDKAFGLKIRTVPLWTCSKIRPIFTNRRLTKTKKKKKKKKKLPQTKLSQKFFPRNCPKKFISNGTLQRSFSQHFSRRNSPPLPSRRNSPPLLSRRNSPPVLLSPVRNSPPQFFPLRHYLLGLITELSATAFSEELSATILGAEELLRRKFSGQC